MKKIVIGLIPTIRNSEEDAYKNQYYFVKQYSKVLYKYNAIPIGLLLNDDKLINETLELCDGFIFPGGSSINPHLYEIFKYAITNHKPILGICLGMQAMGIFSLIEEEVNKLDKNILNISKEDYRQIYDRLKETKPMLLPVNDPDKHNKFITSFTDTADCTHKIIIQNNSLLSKIYEQKEISVVSLHKMRLTRVGHNFQISAFSKDHVIEAIESKKYNFIGVQYHPEALEDSKLFNYFIKLCKDKNIKED